MPSVSSEISFDQIEPRQDAAARLLLLLAKSSIDAAQAEDARGLAREITDWDSFVRTASAKFAVTYMSRHLSACAAEIVPAEILDRMRALARATGMATLRVAAANIAFHRLCIEPVGARHAYMKGVALSAQYGRPIGDRFSRDIDVLVASRDLPAVLEAAAAAGYRVMLNAERGEFTTLSADIRFLGRYADVVTVIGPDSVPVEIHRRLDKLSLSFDLDHAFNTAEDVVISGVPMKVLARPLHCVYVCYHHSRHFWSRLHWLADIDMMIRDPGCDRPALLALGEQIGISPTIQATFDFHELISRPGLWEDAARPAGGGQQFLKACLVNLDGGLDLEVSLRRGMALQDFMSAWQISPGRYNQLWYNTWLRRLRPGVSQYSERRYPPGLYWMYSVESALKLAGNAVGLGLGGRRRSSDDRIQKDRA